MAKAVFETNLFPYKYLNNLIPAILPAYTAYEDGTVFRNFGIYNSDAGESPKRKNTTDNIFLC
jgi:hypothetical protein